MNRTRPDFGSLAEPLQSCQGFRIVVAIILLALLCLYLLQERMMTARQPQRGPRRHCRPENAWQGPGRKPAPWQGERSIALFRYAARISRATSQKEAGRTEKTRALQREPRGTVKPELIA